MKMMLCSLLLLALAGCADVAPWERSTLAKPHMAPDPLPLQSSLRTHVHNSRHGAALGDAAEGGGCGCN